MSTDDDLVRACSDVGLLLSCRSDRTLPNYTLTLDGDPGAPSLCLTVRDDRDVTARLLDVDVEGGGLSLEVSVRTVKREPSFDLWLEDTVRERWHVGRDADGWRLQRAPDGKPSRRR